MRLSRIALAVVTGSVGVAIYDEIGAVEFDTDLA